MKAALDTSRSITKVEKIEECITVKPTEFEEMVELMKGAYEDLKSALRRLHLISKKNPKIFELTSAANSKTDEAWGKLMRAISTKGRREKRRAERPEEVEASTQTSPVMEELAKGKGDSRRALPSGSRNKRKTISLLEAKEREISKRVRRNKKEKIRRRATDSRFMDISESGDE